MSAPAKRLSIIIPSFNDPRIAEAIASVRAFDDIGTVRLVVIDGGSKREIIDLISPLILSDDVFVSERDRGIFDAFNKGLDLSTTEFIGWLGSDDVFTGQVTASDVVRALEQYDLFVANLALYKESLVRRITHSLPSRLGLVRFGLNNPHFTTFGKSALLKSERFRLDLLGSDIEYFLRIFARKPTVCTSNAVAVLMSEGGFSTGASKKTFLLHFQLNQAYAEHTSVLVAPFALLLKTGYKVVNTIYSRIVRLDAAKLLSDKRTPGAQDQPRV